MPAATKIDADLVDPVAVEYHKIAVCGTRDGAVGSGRVAKLDAQTEAFKGALDKIDAIPLLQTVRRLRRQRV